MSFSEDLTSLPLGAVGTRGEENDTGSSTLGSKTLFWPPPSQNEQNQTTKKLNNMPRTVNQ